MSQTNPIQIQAIMATLGISPDESEKLIKKYSDDNIKKFKQWLIRDAFHIYNRRTWIPNNWFNNPKTDYTNAFFLKFGDLITWVNSDENNFLHPKNTYGYRIYHLKNNEPEEDLLIDGSREAEDFLKHNVNPLYLKSLFKDMAKLKKDSLSRTKIFSESDRAYIRETSFYVMQFLFFRLQSSGYLSDNEKSKKLQLEYDINNYYQYVESIFEDYQKIQPMTLINYLKQWLNYLISFIYQGKSDQSTDTKNDDDIKNHNVTELDNILSDISFFAYRYGIDLPSVNDLVIA